MARAVAAVEEQEAILHGQAVAEIAKNVLHFADSMALKCAVELRVADTIQSAGRPITLSEIAAGINCPCVNLSYLERVMRMLVRMKIFTSATSSDNGGDKDKTLYGLTPSSKLLLHDAEQTLAPFLLMQMNPIMQAPWHHLIACVKEGGCGFKKAHGVGLYEYASVNPEHNKLFNDAMRCLSRVSMQSIVSKFKELGFDGVGSVVDVGGGTGAALAEIVKAFPHVKGINFDLPHVVAAAPELYGVTHVSGDMFKVIPSADVACLKHILHNWGDEDCIKILKACRQAIGGKGGKIIILDPVVKENADELFGNVDVVMDLQMMALLDGAKERTELEWKKLLEEADFPRYKIIELPYLSIIEAYPE